VILKAEPLDPSFQWRSHKPDRRPWRIVALLLAIAVGAGFLVGRLSTAGPTSLQQQVAAEQQATSAGSVVQSQGATQSDLAGAATRSVTTNNNAEMKPAAKDEAKTSATASATVPPKAQSTTSTEKGSASPPVVLINPSTADKDDRGVAGEATKKAASKVETEAPAKATSKTETHKSTDDVAPAASKRQARSQSPAHAKLGPAPVRQESAATQRDDAYVAPRRDDPIVGPRRDDAYVPPRVPESTLSDQRDRYEGVERREDRARFEPPYRDRRYPEPEPRFAEDVPPRRDAYEDSRGYLRPFRGARDFRDYRRLDGYDDDVYADRRPVLRPMYGGGPGY
jgi:hypothetical protein